MQENAGVLQIVDFYSRPGCHLCEIVLAAIHEIERVVNIQLNEYNIDENDLLNEEYGLIIPVVNINGKLVQYGDVDINVLKQALLNGN